MHRYRYTVVSSSIGASAVLYLVTWIGLIAAWIHGAVLSFSASTVLGIICLFVPPAEVIFGLAKWFADVDLATRIVHSLPQIFGS